MVWRDRYRLIGRLGRGHEEAGLVASSTTRMKQTKLPFVAEVAKTLDSVPAMHPISGQIGYGLRDEVVEDVAVDVGQASVDAVRTIRQLGVINPQLMKNRCVDIVDLRR